MNVIRMSRVLRSEDFKSSSVKSCWKSERNVIMRFRLWIYFYIILRLFESFIYHIAYQFKDISIGFPAVYHMCQSD